MSFPSVAWTDCEGEYQGRCVIFLSELCSDVHAKRVLIPRRGGLPFRATARGALEERGAVVGLMMLPLSKVKYDDAGRTVEIEVR